jgi:hypothetical protein
MLTGSLLKLFNITTLLPTAVYLHTAHRLGVPSQTALANVHQYVQVAATISSVFLAPLEVIDSTERYVDRWHTELRRPPATPTIEILPSCGHVPSITTGTPVPTSSSSNKLNHWPISVPTPTPTPTISTSTAPTPSASFGYLASILSGLKQSNCSLKYNPETRTVELYVSLASKIAINWKFVVSVCYVLVYHILRDRIIGLHTSHC